MRDEQRAESEYPWQLDGIDATAPAVAWSDGRKVHPYTVEVWNYATWREAIDAMPPIHSDHRRPCWPVA